MGQVTVKCGNTLGEARVKRAKAENGQQELDLFDGYP